MEPSFTQFAIGHVPRPPINRRLIVKPNGQGVTWIAQHRVPKGTVLHSMVGSLWGTDSYFHLPDTAALTDFGIGNTDLNGTGLAEIIQWNDYKSRQVGWASGPVLSPEGDGPAALATNGQDPNIWGVSIERDDGADYDLATAPQWSSICWLMAYIHAEEVGQTADTLEWTMQHYEFCGDDYKKCPHWPIRDYTLEYLEAVRAIMRHCQYGTPYPSGGVWVASRKLTLPEPDGSHWIQAEGDVKEPVPETAIGYINHKGEAIYVWNAGGVAVDVVGINAVDLGMTVRNAAKEQFSVSMQNNEQQPWSGPQSQP